MAKLWLINVSIVTIGAMNDDIRPALGPADDEVQRLSRKKPAHIPRDSSEVFRTPEAIAAQQELEEAPGVKTAEPQAAPADHSGGVGEPKPPETGKTGWRERLALHWPPGRKEALVAGAVAIVLLAGVGGFLLLHHSKKPVVAHHIIKQVPKPVVPKTVPSTLSGLPVDPSVNARPVTGVMIENSQDARPQSGLSQASVVFEAIAEGGITRFLALFQDTAPDTVGPIRSARPYYVQWALGFDAGYAHVGGSPEALTDIKTWGVKDLDQFANGGSYHRISSRAAPHNVYTAIATLNQLEAAKGYTSSTFTGFLRKKESPPKAAPAPTAKATSKSAKTPAAAPAPTAKTIDIAISGPLYNVHYDYVAATNSYNRSEGGAPHIDANGNALISPKVVVVMVMPYGLEADDHHSQYGTIGSGQAFIFQDGGSVTGQWTKTTEKSQFTFTDAAGKPIGLNPGQTWLTAVGNAGSVTSAP